MVCLSKSGQKMALLNLWSVGADSHRFDGFTAYRFPFDCIPCDRKSIKVAKYTSLKVWKSTTWRLVDLLTGRLVDLMTCWLIDFTIPPFHSSTNQSTPLTLWLVDCFMAWLRCVYLQWYSSIFNWLRCVYLQWHSSIFNSSHALRVRRNLRCCV